MLFPAAVNGDTVTILVFDGTWLCICLAKQFFKEVLDTIFLLAMKVAPAPNSPQHWVLPVVFI